MVTSMEFGVDHHPLWGFAMSSLSIYIALIDATLIELTEALQHHTTQIQSTYLDLHLNLIPRAAFKLLGDSTASRCHFCKNLSISHLVELAQKEFEATEFPKHAFYQHHESFSDLEASADGGCDFCQMILECFKGTPCRDHSGWPDEWHGRACDIGNSIYSRVKNFPISDVRIAINSDHYRKPDNVGEIDLFDIIMVKVGPRSSQRGPDGMASIFRPLELTISTPRRGLSFLSI